MDPTANSRSSEAEICALPSRDAVADAALKRVLTVGRDAIAARGSFHLVLSGGSTPAALYDRLAQLDSSALDWSAVHVYWGDERAVPPSDEDSNYRLAFETWLEASDIPEAQMHRMHGEAIDLAEAAQEYADEIANGIGPDGVVDGFPRFDLILLGMGDDGHTASLFPETLALKERSAWVVANDVSVMSARRLTLTFPVFQAARHVLFLVTGASKQSAISRVFQSESCDLPAARVQPTDGRLEWYLDRDAIPSPPPAGLKDSP